MLFFIVMTGSLFSGLLISKDVMSMLGIQLNVSQSWKSIHTLMSDASVILLGVHIALHWKWILSTVSRYVVNPIRGLFQLGVVSPVLTAQPVRVEKSK